MKVFILTEGGKKIGLGHITRCIGLYQAFEKQGIIPKLLVNADNSVRFLLRHKNYKIFNWLKEKSALLGLLHREDLVIIDSYVASLPFYKEVSQLINCPIYIDDNQRINYPKGILINGSVYAQKIRYPKRKDSTYLLGTKYLPLRKEFWNIPRRRIKREIINIMITFGGKEHGNWMHNLLSYLKGKFHFNFTAVDAKKHKADVRRMRDLMLNADVCISGGGQTIYELACCGTPTIGICFAANQLLNLKGSSRAGFLEFAGRYDDDNLFKKIEEYFKVLNYRKRVKMSRTGQRLVNGQSVNKVIREILKCMKSKH